jgi:uncharacterized membrane protein (UPF0127 family)
MPSGRIEGVDRAQRHTHRPIVISTLRGQRTQHCHAELARTEHERRIGLSFGMFHQHLRE